RVVAIPYRRADRALDRGIRRPGRSRPDQIWRRRGPGGTRRAGAAGLARVAAGPLHALPTLRAGRPHRPRAALNPLAALGADRPLHPLAALRPGGARHALTPLAALRARRTLRPDELCGRLQRVVGEDQA